MLLFAIGAAGFGTALLAYAAWIWWGLRRPVVPQRTPDDVHRDVDINRACRRFAQVLDDADNVWTIWPDPPTARVIELQHRLDQHWKEEDR